MKRSALVLLCSLCSVLSVSAANIAWVSFHTNDSPASTAATAAGYTEAPDIGYTSLLAANGHTVTRFLTVDGSAAALAPLNSYDLVIVGRSVNSGHYQTASETAAWSGITAPMIIMGGYTLRASRLGYTTGEGIPDTAGEINLKLTQPHPIFAGVAMDGFSGLTLNPYATTVTFGTNVQRGISVNTNAVEAGGTVLATVGTASDPAFGGMIIGEWQAGSVINGGTDTLGGHRLVFLSGTRETSGITSESAGMFDLTADGTKMFLNAVTYMAVPEPSTIALTVLGGLGGLALVLRRRRA